MDGFIYSVGGQENKWLGYDNDNDMFDVNIRGYEIER
ncbi:MAG: hypothetical protein ACD_79C01302G0022 [uncultured bacterium]|nr:MAG: hypothetical protein ACD_79C01302G0022 [uncultured bacterium]